MAAFYLNELLMKLTTRHDPLPALFDTYHDDPRRPAPGRAARAALAGVRKASAGGAGLRPRSGAEAQTGKRIEPDEYYHFRPEQGLVATVADAAGALAGHSLIGLANEHLAGARELEDAKRLLQAALAQCLEGRPLATRAVARAVARRELKVEQQT